MKIFPKKQFAKFISQFSWAKRQHTFCLLHTKCNCYICICIWVSLKSNNLCEFRGMQNFYQFLVWWFFEIEIFCMRKSNGLFFLDDWNTCEVFFYTPKSSKRIHEQSKKAENWQKQQRKEIDYKLAFFFCFNQMKAWIVFFPIVQNGFFFATGKNHWIFVSTLWCVTLHKRIVRKRRTAHAVSFNKICKFNVQKDLNLWLIYLPISVNGFSTDFGTILSAVWNDSLGRCLWSMSKCCWLMNNKPFSLSSTENGCVC